MTDAYPTDADLERIAQWSYDDAVSWFAFIKSLWWPAGWGWDEEDTLERQHQSQRKVHHYNLSTGGWSGNEELIDAMKRNYTLWAMTWRCSRRGGHFEFGRLL